MIIVMWRVSLLHTKEWANFYSTHVVPKLFDKVILSRNYDGDIIARSVIWSIVFHVNATPPNLRIHEISRHWKNAPKIILCDITIIILWSWSSTTLSLCQQDIMFISFIIETNKFCGKMRSFNIIVIIIFMDTLW